MAHGTEAKERAGSPAAANPEGSPPLDAIQREGRRPPPPTRRGSGWVPSASVVGGEEGFVPPLLLPLLLRDGARERSGG